MKSAALWPATWLGRALAVLTAWIVIIAAIAWPRQGRTAAVNRPIQVPAKGMVTSDTCRSCHPGNYANWHESFHRTMTQVALPANVLAPIDGAEMTRDGWTYRGERKDGAYFIKRRPSGSAPTAFEAPREVVLMTGSHNMQFYWLATGRDRTLEHFPFGWLVQEKKWAPLDDTFLGPPEFHALKTEGGDWNRGCIDCHTTQGRSRLLTNGNFDSRVTEFGISCEACHGGAEAHVAREHNPLTRYFTRLTGRPDPTIANPARMDGPKSAMVCGQCHSVWSFSTAMARADWNRDGSKFHPGEGDLNGRFVVQPADGKHMPEKRAILASNPYFFQDSYWPDGMVRVVGREYNGVQDSPCFKGGQFSCLSCHEMHSPPADAAVMRARAVNQLRPDGLSDSACLQCHQKIGEHLTEHTHHAAKSEGSRCYDCHMPHSSFGLLRAVRSHQVSVPSVKESTAFGRPNACNLCHLDKTLQWTADTLHLWYGKPVPELPPDDRRISAAVKWLLKGDAGQRALIAWSMGWAPAQKASGRDWLGAYLTTTLVDPYAAVRFAAGKSLQTLPGFEKFTFDYTADRLQIKAAATKAFQDWVVPRRAKPESFDPAVLIDPDGEFEFAHERLLLERDTRFIFLVE